MSRKRIELVFSLLIVVLLVWVVWEPRAWPPHSRLFPWTVGFVVLVLAFTQLGSAIRDAYKPPEAETVSEGQSRAVERKALCRRAITICVWIVGFYCGIWLFGFKLGSLVLTFAFLRFFAREPWWISGTLSLGTYVFFLLVFDLSLHMPLGAGAIADYFGMQSFDFYLVRAIRSLFGAA